MARKLSRRAILNRIKIRIPPVRNVPRYMTGFIANYIASYSTGSSNDYGDVEWHEGDTMQWSESDNLEW